MSQISLNWTDFKANVTSRSLPMQYVVANGAYYLFASDGALEFSTVIQQASPAGTDQADFEASYKAQANKNGTQRDSDYAPFARIKHAPTGWSYQKRGIEYTTSLLTSSLQNFDYNNNALSDATLTCYDANGTSVTGSGLTTAVKTVLDIEPTYDYYLIAGEASSLTTPTTDVRLSVIGAPDVPANYGGTKVFIQNVNFKYIAAFSAIAADGRASKLLSYNATYHSNKLRFVLFHQPGFQGSFEVTLEHYKQ